VEGNSYYIEPATSDIDGAKNIARRTSVLPFHKCSFMGYENLK